MTCLFRALILSACCSLLATSLHAHSPAEDTEIGIKILYEAGPLPAMTQQKSTMTFLIRDLNAEEGADPVAGVIENTFVTIKKDEKLWGPFEVKESSRNPGKLTLDKVFAEPGEYEVYLSFNKAGDATPREFHWDSDIADWNDLVLD
jgi:hypothetical protein